MTIPLKRVTISVVCHNDDLDAVLESLNGWFEENPVSMISTGARSDDLVQDEMYLALQYLKEFLEGKRDEEAM